MSLNLDTRQRAMLLEMGIAVWLPESPAAESPFAIETGAVSADAASATGVFCSNLPDSPGFSGSLSGQPGVQASGAVAARREAVPPARPASSPVRAPAAARAASAPSMTPAQPAPEAQDGAAPAWRLGVAQALYADTAQTGGARWLVLAETPASALSGPVFQGDAGQLLGNMLRAARLHRAGAVLLAPLVRQGAGAPAPEFLAELAALTTQAQPDIVLIMGRLAVQALLPSGEPFGKLRGQIHALHGVPAIATYDATYLLRAPADKAKAWADLCLAMSLTPAPASSA